MLFRVFGDLPDFRFGFLGLDLAAPAGKVPVVFAFFFEPYSGLLGIPISLQLLQQGLVDVGLFGCAIVQLVGIAFDVEKLVWNIGY